MFKGYRNHLIYKDKTNKSINSLLTRCTKCLKLNTRLHPPAINNVQTCFFCGNPFYIIKATN